MNAVLAAPRAAQTAPDAIRVMIVDDSAVVRGLVARWLDEEADLHVVASLRTGREAVEQIERVDADVVILDIEMPELDGLSALPLLLAKQRDLVVIMASSLTRRHAEVSLRALAIGATDYVPKPESNRGISTSPEFRRELVDKVRQLGARRLRRHPRVHAPPPSGSRSVRGLAESRAAASDLEPPPLILRAAPSRSPRVLLFGASTGGPQALTALITQLNPIVDRYPVLIVQHMPPTFTTILTEHLTRVSGRPVREPQDGDPVASGVFHLAPGGQHMLVERRDGQAIIRVQDGPPVNFCKPAVDPLLISASRVWPGAALAVVLTGMGRDGTEGAHAIAASGGNVIAQDEATSVVWGMPGAVARAGLCSAVLPLDQIASKVRRLFAGDAS